MQLERIRIEHLFDRFSHDINLRSPEKITIIHAPNGFGKTVILTLVNAFFARHFSLFFKYQFRSFFLHFDNHQVVEIRKIEGLGPSSSRGKQREGGPEIHISLVSEHTTEPIRLTFSESMPQLNRALPFIEPAGPDLWFDSNTDEIIGTGEVLTKYGLHLPPAMRKELPDWLTQLLESTECRLIETQRLLRIARPDDYPRLQRRGSGPTRAVVEMEARDLANRIGATLADYANRSQSLDQSFPRRVIEALGSGTAPEADVVSTRLQEVEQKRSSLIDVGLLDKAGAPEVLSPAELRGQPERQVIGVYLDDMEQKFSRFDQLFQRVSLFKEIINEKFQFKDIFISREKGISVTADGGSDISLTDLSSGEQHELVLIYELLFGVKDDALILIDEPELSLHVGWQIRFLPDLQRIQRLRSLQIILATHSPQIINERWDLTVELKS